MLSSSRGRPSTCCRDLTCEVHNLFADLKREEGFVLFDRICHRLAAISLPANGLIEILTGKVAQGFAQRTHSFR